MADSVWRSEVAWLGTKNFSSWCVCGKFCFWMVWITYQILNECSTGKTTITWLAVAPTLEVIHRTMRALWMATPTPCLAVWTMLLASQGSIWSRYSCTHVAALCTNKCCTIPQLCYSEVYSPLTLCLYNGCWVCCTEWCWMTCCIEKHWMASCNRWGTLGDVASSDLEPGTTMAQGTICMYPSLSQCHCKWMSYLQDETCMIHPILFTVYGAPLGAVAACTMLSTV